MRSLMILPIVTLVAAINSCRTTNAESSVAKAVQIKQHTCSCTSEWICQGGAPSEGKVTSEGVIKSTKSEDDAKQLCDENLKGQLTSFCGSKTINLANKNYVCKFDYVDPGQQPHPPTVYVGVNPFTDADFAKITSAYSMAKTETTQDQWTKVMGENPSKFKEKKYCPTEHKEVKTAKGKFEMCPNNPVETVSWNDVKVFLVELNKLAQGSGNSYRLPIAKEWWAAASGYIDPRGNCMANSNGQTHPVGSKANPPRNFNRFGLYDTSGNVREWTETPTPGVFRYYILGSCIGDENGDFGCPSQNNESANKPDKHDSMTGFRLVRTSP